MAISHWLVVEDRPTFSSLVEAMARAENWSLCASADGVKRWDWGAILRLCRERQAEFRGKDQTVALKS
jgi:hypothetical protein